MEFSERRAQEISHPKGLLILSSPPYRTSQINSKLRKSGQELIAMFRSLSKSRPAGLDSSPAILIYVRVQIESNYSTKIIALHPRCNIRTN